MVAENARTAFRPPGTRSYLSNAQERSGRNKRLLAPPNLSLPSSWWSTEDRNSAEKRIFSSGCTRTNRASACSRSSLSPARTGIRRSRQWVGAIKLSTVSTTQLRAFRPLHLWPINLVVYEGSHAKATKSYLEGGFPLRCFQRLSLPHVATQRWPERANWITRGVSIPILSY